MVGGPVPKIVSNQAEVPEPALSLPKGHPQLDAPDIGATRRIEY